MKKTDIISMIIAIILCIQNNSDAQTLYNGVGHILEDYQLTWHEAGLLQNIGNMEPKLVRTISPGVADSQVESAIDAAEDNSGLTIIYFPEGTYYFNSPIELTSTDHNIVFQGAGSDKTTLVFQNIWNSDCFLISGWASGWSANCDLDQSINKGSSTLHSTTNGGLNSISENDWVHFIKYTRCA